MLSVSVRGISNGCGQRRPYSWASRKVGYGCLCMGRASSRDTLRKEGKADGGRPREACRAWGPAASDCFLMAPDFYLRAFALAAISSWEFIPSIHVDASALPQGLFESHLLREAVPVYPHLHLHSFFLASVPPQHLSPFDRLCSLPIFYNYLAPPPRPCAP